MSAVRAPRGAEPPAGALVEITDEREPIARDALEVVAETFPSSERQPITELSMEIEEKRRELLSAYDFHLIAGVVGDEAAGTAIGVYLEGVNAGFISYLAVRPRFRGRQLAPRLRSRLIEAFRADARIAGNDDLAWALGEVRADNRWLGRLVRRRGVIPFDLTYYHPGMVPGASDVRFLLYRQPLGDARLELPAPLVRRVLYATYRRVYRVRYPLQLPGFRAMLAELAGRETVGVHPDYAL